MIDTHAHLNLKKFDGDRSEVMASCREMDLEVINVGIDYVSSVRAVEIARESGFYAAAGIHPNGPEESLDIFSPLWEREEVVAVGETGLDFYRQPNNPEEKHRQQRLLYQHGQLARESKRPLILHCRQAYPELIAALRKDLKELDGVVHSFSGSLSDARELLQLGYYLGFSGLIFKLDLDEVIKSTPLERILVETDSPYLPPPSLNQKRNAPHLGLRPVLEKIAFVKKIPVSEMIEKTQENAQQLFKLKKNE